MWRILPLLLLTGAAPTGWRVADPARLLVIDTNLGRIVIEMDPRVAPRAVERVSLLARRGTYDGLLFHRVIDKFVAQTGNPNNRDGGGTELPDLKPEFWVPEPESDITWVRTTGDGREGMIGSLPVAKGIDPFMPAWVAHCTGLVGMGRQAAPATANSEFYITRGSTMALNHDYTLFGRVLAGQDVVDRLAVGVPPAKPDRMARVRSAADLSSADRPRLAVMDVRSREYFRWAAAKRHSRAAQLSICDMLPPAKSLTKPENQAR